MKQLPVILLVEDEPLAAFTVQDALEEAGFAVHHVAFANDAFRALEGKQLDFAGVITDIQLGGRSDGWAVARRARELIPGIPVVYVAGESAHQHTVQGVPDSTMLRKPFASAQIITAIATLLNAIPPR